MGRVAVWLSDEQWIQVREALISRTIELHDIVEYRAGVLPQERETAARRLERTKWALAKVEERLIQRRAKAPGLGDNLL